MTIGLVFRDNNEVMLGKFEEGVIVSFMSIRDDNGVYEDLNNNQFAVVTVLNDDDDSEIVLKYHRPITMVQEQEEITISEFLSDLQEMSVEDFERTWASMYNFLARDISPISIH